jgi:acyl carrier protein
MRDPIEIRCARIFRKAAGIENIQEYAAVSDIALVGAQFDRLDIDSLAIMEFIMEVEAEFGVELDENKVSRCASVADVAVLVSDAVRA